MNIKPYIFLSAIALFTACNGDPVPPAYSVGEVINEITLRAGIIDGGSGAATKAAAEDHHATPGHKTFGSTTGLTLRVDGTWLGKGFTNNLVSKTTTGTTGAKTGADNLHNTVIFSTTSDPVEQLYWDDYGTADPANMPDVVGNGRDKGLTIYGSAVEGVAAAPAITSWTAQTWNVGTLDAGVIDQTGGWTAKDLLTSNNIQEKDNGKPFATDGTYKFDDYVYDLKNSTNTASNLLEFTHAMTKITVNLTAGEGFPGYETGAVNAKFNDTPKVTLLGFNYIGTVDIENKTSTPTSATTANIKMHTVTGGNVHFATLDALVFPGNTFSATIAADSEHTPTSTINILELNADGNIYKVTAAQLVKAIAGTSTTGTPVYGTLAQGKNYILNITVNKTRIVVTATIKDWMDVVADSETPKINVVANVGDATVDANTKDRMPSFDFYLSDAAGANASTAYDKKATATKPTEGADGTTVWSFDNPLYWPNHQIHYLMRGVSPINTTVSSGKIDVSNIDYDAAATSMSNLLVGAPVITPGTMCGNGDHTAVDMSTDGICAREGKINLTFDYMMSQLEVHLTTAASTAPEYVNLTNAKVELVNVYNAGQVDIHTKIVTTTGSTGDFEVKHVGTENANYRHSAVVPQDLTFTTAGATTNLRFKITIYKNGDVAEGIDDIYYADVNPIKVTEPGDSESKAITKWDSGKHYIYTLDLKKTAIKVTVTLTDWVPVSAEENVWF